MSLLEIKDNRLIEAYDNKYLEVLCVGVINNIWGKRNRVKTYKNGKTSPLYELAEFHRVIVNEPSWDLFDTDRRPNESVIRAEHLPDEGKDYDFNRDIDETLLLHIIERHKESRVQDERFISRVFYHSRFTYKNVRTFAKESGLPYGVCCSAFNRFKKIIKEELCKY